MAEGGRAPSLPGEPAAQLSSSPQQCPVTRIDVTTTGPSVSPIMSYDTNTGVGTIVGFRATNGVDIKTKVGYAGQVYDAGIAAGVNQSSGITFRLQDESRPREEALRMAVEVAFKEAGIVATAANVQLGGPETIQIEAGGGRIIRRTEAFDAKAVTTPTIPDDLTITASVQIVFRTRG